jgi:hypothetical protein
MARPLAKSSFVLLALGLCIFASSASWAEDADPKALNQQVIRAATIGATSKSARAGVGKRRRRQYHPRTSAVGLGEPASEGAGYCNRGDHQENGHKHSNRVRWSDQNIDGMTAVIFAIKGQGVPNR